MSTTQYITNTKGKKLFVVLPLKEYKRMVEDLEELKDLRIYDAAKSSKEKSLPAKEAFAKIEAKRKKK
jgi:PHD/YefM family antitoxin component YafN of YafNO toxin-antitoxin module